MTLEDRSLLSTIIVNNTTDRPVSGRQPPPGDRPGERDRRGQDDHSSTRTVFSTPQTITLAGGSARADRHDRSRDDHRPGGGLDGQRQQPSRVFQVDGGVTAAISGLTITGRAGTDHGGGIYDDGGTVTLTDCTVSSNTAYFGGGLANVGGTATLNNCTISGNSATVAGGVYGSGTTTLTGTTITSNSAEDAGGVANSGTLTLTNCTVTGNSASNTGGGLDNIGVATLTGDHFLRSIRPTMAAAWPP